MSTWGFTVLWSLFVHVVIFVYLFKSGLLTPIHLCFTFIHRFVENAILFVQTVVYIFLANENTHLKVVLLLFLVLFCF